MTLDARALVALVNQESGYEQIVTALAGDRNPRVCASALADSGMLLTGAGHILPSVLLDMVIHQFRLTVVPFIQITGGKQ